MTTLSIEDTLLLELKNFIKLDDNTKVVKEAIRGFIEMKRKELKLKEIEDDLKGVWEDINTQKGEHTGKYITLENE